ncbi:BZ3500_MvSof-1268-A1-R1_Chr7-1g09071 [Microbotryum saponariae]|uniref:BZ3500_MvSof-1268-A1-R1_Chr7-1g09071 protein n=1 Tax=Microbotryum saponariae TaxID=289078 RepID=A0A2X0M193_9BASI|nr:BZ3501_MvSof-1269-A2-R1_Chr7-1g08775 [Microbotryum saponariae]SDA02735.1 BZ3500_MvSof-1268-A1-R1_Chr7-1g09071 [Microbotryum saponariae]
MSKRGAVKVYKVSLTPNPSRNASKSSLTGDAAVSARRADKPLVASVGSAISRSSISPARRAPVAAKRFESDSDSEAASDGVSEPVSDAASDAAFHSSDVDISESKLDDCAIENGLPDRPSRHILVDQHILVEREVEREHTAATPDRTRIARNQSAQSFVPPVTSVRVDLSNWATGGQLPVQVEDKEKSLGRLPPISMNVSPLVVGEGDPSALRGGMTSSSPMDTHNAKKGIESRIQGTMYEIFERTMSNPPSRRKFREWLSNTHRDVAVFDLWKDLNAFRALSRNVTLCAAALHELGDSVNRGALPSKLRAQLDEGLQDAMGFEGKLVDPQAHLLDVEFSPFVQAIYKNDFQDYIRQLTVVECQAMLEKASSIHDQHAAAFYLTNPRESDHPIELVSPGFEDLTGHEAKQIIGRNSRFLSGPQPFDATTTTMREAISAGQPCYANISARSPRVVDTIILNYRSSGEPFYTLLSVTPIRDSNNTLCYFLGSQTDVTDLLEERLRKLVGMQKAKKGDGVSPGGIVDEFSPSFKFFASAVGMTLHENYDQANQDDLLGKEMPIVQEVAGFQQVLQDHSTTSVVPSFADGATTKEVASLDAGRKKQPNGKSSSGSGAIKKFWDKINHHPSPTNTASATGAQQSESSLNEAARFAPATVYPRFSLQCGTPLRATISEEPHALYSRLLVFVVPSRQIFLTRSSVYLSPSTVEFLGNNISSTSNPHQSNLLQTDVLSLITSAPGPPSPPASSVGETTSSSYHSGSFSSTLSAGERVREKFLDAVVEGKEMVLEVGVKVKARKTRLDYPMASIDQTSGDKIAKVKVRLSPLKRGDSKVEAFVLV